MILGSKQPFFKGALLVSYRDEKRYPKKMLCFKIWPVATAGGCSFSGNKVKCKMVATTEKC